MSIPEIVLRTSAPRIYPGLYPGRLRPRIRATLGERNHKSWLCDIRNFAVSGYRAVQTYR